MKEVFSRQTPLWGEEGEERLRKTCVLIAGAGGLGTAVAEALVRLGIGTLYLVDSGKIDLPDLNRQILYAKKDIGKPKVEVAREKLFSYGLCSKIIALSTKIDEGFELPSEVEIVVDALDNWKSRFFLEEACEKKGIPFVHAGLNGDFGQLTTILPGSTKRLREIFAGAATPSSPIPAHAPICMVLAGIQAMEVVKLILKRGEPLLNKLLMVDLLNFSFEIIEL